MKSLVFLTLFLSLVNGLKFKIPAGTSGHSRCVTQFIGGEVLVSGTVDVGPGANQRIDLTVYEKDDLKNQYFSKTNIKGHVKFTFTTHDSGVAVFCIINTLDKGLIPSDALQRNINLHIDVGAEAHDYTRDTVKNKLDPVELELEKIDSIIHEVNEQMEYMKAQEYHMRDINELTNDRIRWFSITSMFVLVGLGSVQIIYLKHFFEAKVNYHLTQ